ncbi:MAG: nucleotidyltransferase domain-containing protein [Sulfuriferula sp.]
MFDCLPTRVQTDATWVTRLDAAGWDKLIRQARHSELLPRIHGLLERRGLLESAPAAPRAHLDSARVVADKQAVAIRWEVRKIHEALVDVDVPVVLLKGAAYTMQGCAAALGRIYSDVDILVPKNRINNVEAALMLHGWVATQHDAYDQRYYRTWMHEIPPLMHIKRLAVIDVHHGILPETARLRPDPALLLATAQPIVGEPGLYTLAPADMVLHSASHLFCGEFEHGLRDLSDIDLLLREFSTTAGFWDELVPRAQQLDLMRPLYYALHWAIRLFATPVPANVLNAINTCAQPLAPVKQFMNTLLQRALAPDHISCRDALSAAARMLLYTRAHWLRMPPHLLAYHLAHKALFPPRPAEH